jgi:hypothetical protein
MYHSARHLRTRRRAVQAPHIDHATPTEKRAVASYPARRSYRPGVLRPPEVPSVQDTIDVHCHAHEGQQDALAVAQLASRNGMGGLLFKTIGQISGNYEPERDVDAVNEQLKRWADAEGVAPARCWAGYGITMNNKPATVAETRRHIEAGAVGIWMPVFNHANTWNKVGGIARWIDKDAPAGLHTDPLPWDQALKAGYYLIDEKGRLLPLYDEIIRVVCDYGRTIFFGHCTHDEIFAIVELMDRLGHRKGVLDHPYSPFVDLTIPQMKQLAAAGMLMNFTFDELSPLLGVDPAEMYQAIREVGPEHCVLSSDAGEPLFPNSVECMRLVRGYMEAFGCTPAELRTMTVDNPRKVVGLN